jgi:catechol-2,3-dioxygenase
MKSAWNHLQFNIESANRAFYKDLFTLLGWEQWHEDDKMLGMGVEGKGSFWFASAPGKRKTDYDQLGVNHIAVRAEEQKDVDTAATFLKRSGVPALFARSLFPELMALDGHEGAHARDRDHGGDPLERPRDGDRRLAVERGVQAR